MKALKLFSISRVFESNKGESFRLHMDLFLLPDAVASKRQLSQYRLSWTFFNSENPDLRILMDNHEPIGLHVHIVQNFVPMTDPNPV